MFPVRSFIYLNKKKKTFTLNRIRTRRESFSSELSKSSSAQFLCSRLEPSLHHNLRLTKEFRIET